VASTTGAGGLMANRRRKLAMVGAGLATAASPLLLGQAGAGVAEVLPHCVVPLGWPPGRCGPSTCKPVGEVAHLDRYGDEPSTSGP
jgi:hypothetical protein